MSWIQVHGKHDDAPILLRADTIVAVWVTSPEREVTSSLMGPVRSTPKPTFTQVQTGSSVFDVAETVGEVWDKIEEAGAD